MSKFHFNFTSPDSGNLQKITKKGGKIVSTQEVVLDEEEKASILKDAHDTTGGHLGLNKTQSKIAERFYWQGITNDVKAFISECDACQRSATVLTETKKLVPIKTNESMELIGVDLIGPLKETKDGNKYCLTITDLWSKWVAFYPIPNKSGISVYSKLETFFPCFWSAKKGFD